ncbi:hypothetical protein [Variovorax sp. 160MFSha2.1]|uniref:hypothetical protein n=1 Tax=Variovorax sp. 160MFSha2.1 TaxID=3158367 RepID=UPI003AABB655
MTDPLVPAECDLRDFPYLPVDVQRLLTSETWVLGKGDERAAAMALWLQSWHQVPAASLPENDRMLGHLAQVANWKRVKPQALRGWVLCTDGRLYHPVVAEKALEAWVEKLVNSFSGSIGNASRWGIEVDTASTLGQILFALDCLRKLAPQSKVFKKKAVAKIVAGSPPESPPDNAGGSPPDAEKHRPPIAREEKRREGINRETDAGGRDPDPPAATPGTTAGEACKAMRQAGLQDANPGHPELIALLAAGMTVDELACAASDTARAGKGFVYALRTAASRRRDAANVGTLPAAAPMRAQPTGETAYQRTQRERMQRDFPSIAAKAPTASNRTPTTVETEATDVTARRLG